MLIGEGVLDRFPSLRFVFLESGCGWVPYWFDRLNEHYEVLGVQVPALKTEPAGLLERGTNFIFRATPKRPSCPT